MLISELAFIEKLNVFSYFEIKINMRLYYWKKSWF